MLPKEHGTYGQVGFPLATALILAGGNGVALLLSVSVLCGFLLHEPLQVLLGARGRRQLQAERRVAIGWALVCGCVALLSGIAGVAAMDQAFRWTIVWPLAPACYVFLAEARGALKRTSTEIGAAIAFSLAAIPICLSAALVDAAVLVGFTYAVTFTLMTLGVQVVILTTRAGGDTRAVGVTRLYAVSLAVASMVALIGASATGVLTRWAPLALVPGTLSTLWLALRPPRAAQIRSVGWTLVATSAAAMGILIALLAG